MSLSSVLIYILNRGGGQNTPIVAGTFLDPNHPTKSDDTSGLKTKSRKTQNGHQRQCSPGENRCKISKSA